jgi:hypothetical protein
MAVAEAEARIFIIVIYAKRHGTTTRVEIGRKPSSFIALAKTPKLPVGS